MGKKHRYRFSQLQTAVLIFILVLVAVICYLFYPTFRCVYEWDEFSAACQEEFMLTLLMPFAIFFALWGTLFTFTVLIFRKRK